MKKAILLLLLFSMNIAAFAHNELHFFSTQRYHFPDTIRAFRLHEMETDVCIKKLINALGNPTTNTTGIITWSKVTIKGLDAPLQLQVKDGVMTHYPKNRSACWSPFSSEADKQHKLTTLNKDQERDMEIELTDQSGENIINSEDKEKMIEDFLAGILE